MTLKTISLKIASKCRRLAFITAATFAGLSATMSGSAFGATISDDFNDGVVSGWTERTGMFTESGGSFRSTDFGLATLDGVTGSQISVDAVTTGGLSYTALVMNYTSLSDHLFVKIQDNNANGLFDSVFFKHGNNTANGVTGSNHRGLATEVAATNFELKDNLDGTVTVTVGATGDIFTATLLNAYTGTGVGLGFYGNGAADNFYVGPAISPSAVPVPAALPLLLGALGGLGIVARRRKQRTA